MVWNTQDATATNEVIRRFKQGVRYLGEESGRSIESGRRYPELCFGKNGAIHGRLIPCRLTSTNASIRILNSPVIRWRSGC